MPPEEGTPAAVAGTEANGAAAGATPAAGSAEGGGAKTIPYERFAEQAKALRTVLDQNKAYETELATLRTTASSAETYKSQAEAAAKKYESHMAIGRALGGIPEPDVVDVIEFAFGRLPETERTAGMGPVLDSWRTDPSKAPPSVRPHFQPPPNAAANAAGGDRPPSRPPVDPHKSVVQTPNPAQGNITAEQIYAMSPAEYLQYSNAQRVARGLPPHPTTK